MSYFSDIHDTAVNAAHTTAALNTLNQKVAATANSFDMLDSDLKKLDSDLKDFASKSQKCCDSTGDKLDQIIDLLKKLIAQFQPEVTGLGVEFGTPVPRKETTMPSVTLHKKSSPSGKKMLAAGPVPHKVGDPAPNVVIFDNEDDTFTVFGTSPSNPQIDISGVATETTVSSDPTVLTLDPPVGFTDQLHALKAGPAVITITATWNDGSKTLTIDQPVTITTDPNSATGLGVTFGTPTIRP